MKIIPKFAGGGSTGSFFTVYQATQTPQIQAPTSTRTTNDTKDSVTVKDSSKDESSSKKESSDGKLTEKELFSMIKDVDAMPNEMRQIIASLKRTMQTSSLLGYDSNYIANTYLNALYKIKIAKQNKDKFNASITDAKANGSLGEAAISMDGQLFVQNEKGTPVEVSVDEYLQNKDKYHLLTNSNLAYLRQYDPKFAFMPNDDIFNIINNGVGFESFQKAIDTAKKQLGNYQYSETGIAGKDALAGLKTFQRSSSEEQQKYIKEALDGKYRYTSTVSTNANNIKAYLEYLTAVLPDRIKTWASIKTGIMDKTKATQALVGQYLMGDLTESSTYSTSYLGTEAKLKNAGSHSGDGTSSEPKKGFWQQLQTDQGGDTQNYTLLVGKGQMSVTGKYYGTTPGMEENTSLTKYIGNSKVGYLIKDTKGITFGDQTISTTSFDDVMVNASGGAMVATLPITPDGKVNFDILNTYTKVENKLRAAGLTPGTTEYNKTKTQVLKKVGLGYLIDAANGEVNPKYFGHFLILEGVASNKTKTSNNGESKTVELDDYVKDASGDNQLFGTVRKALSDKDKGEYKLDNNWFAFNNDKLFKGNIYIPLNSNALNGANADENDVKVTQAQDYEHAMQRQEERQNNWEKAHRKQSTDANLIFK